MIAARPDRPTVRTKCGFTLPELVVTLLIATVLIGAYIGAMDYNEAMQQALRPLLRPSTTNHLGLVMQAGLDRGAVGITPVPGQSTPGAQESSGSSGGAQAPEMIAPEPVAAPTVTGEPAAE